MKIEFWYEFASTYSYLSAMRIEALAKEKDVEVVWKPFLLGPIFNSQGWNDSPFNIYPAKGDYMWRDMTRQCKAYGLPFKQPEIFPAHSVTAARLAWLGSKDTWCPDFSRKVYSAQFADGKDISDDQVLGDILKTLGLPADDLLARARDPETKSGLRSQTDEAMEKGLFGAPSFMVSGELYWGDDRLDAALKTV
jgi:2-hydroxychromene-2-carboxylate isomerase